MTEHIVCSHNEKTKDQILFIFGQKSKISNHAFLKIQVSLFLLAGGGQSLEVGSTGLGNISGLLGDEGSVGVGGEGGGDRGNSHMVSKPGVEVGGGSQTGDQVDRCLSLTLLPSGLGNGGEMSLTGLNHIGRLLGNQGTVGVSSEGGSNRGQGQVVPEESAKVGVDDMGGSHTGDQVDGHLSLTLLTSSLSNGGKMGGSKSWNKTEKRTGFVAKLNCESE